MILEIELDTSGEQPKVRYELANRSDVTRISDTEFVVVQTGAVLNMTPPTLLLNRSYSEAAKKTAPE